MTEQLASKRALRTKMNMLRQALTEVDRQAVSATICQHLLEFIESRIERSSGVVMTYMPYREEVDVLPLTEQLWKNGYTVAVPKVERTDNQLDVHIVQGLGDLEAGAWGIMEPRPTTVQVDTLASIACIVVPGLAYDQAGGRLGYGGGFYDRFFERFERGGLPLPLRIGVCYGGQLLEYVPMESHDYTVDAVVTEQGIVLTSPKCS